MKLRIQQILLVVLCSIVLIFIINACAKDDTNDQWADIKEPITFLWPDTNWISLKKGDTTGLSVALVTDRPIDSLYVTYHIDSNNRGFTPGLDMSYPLYNKVFLPDSNNKQRFDGFYQVPNDTTVSKQDIVRLYFKMFAGALKYDKILRIDVR